MNNRKISATKIIMEILLNFIAIKNRFRNQNLINEVLDNIIDKQSNNDNEEHQD